MKDAMKMKEYLEQCEAKARELIELYREDKINVDGINEVVGEMWMHGFQFESLVFSLLFSTIVDVVQDTVAEIDAKRVGTTKSTPNDMLRLSMLRIFQNGDRELYNDDIPLHDRYYFVYMRQQGESAGLLH
jgi:hypothetical protein